MVVEVQHGPTLLEQDYFMSGVVSIAGNSGRFHAMGGVLLHGPALLKRDSAAADVVKMADSAAGAKTLEAVC